MDLEKLLRLVISGGVTGTIYSLIAAGLVLTYSTSGIFNFAHGAIAFTAAWVFYELNTGLHWPIVPAAVVAVAVFAPLLGLLLDRVMFRYLAKATDTARIVGTVGLTLALPAVTLFVIKTIFIDNLHFGLPFNEGGSEVQGLGPQPKTVWHITSGITFDTDQLVVLVAAAVSALALWLVISHTRLGLSMRATVDRPSLASLRGVDPDRTSAIAWMLGTVLAGLAGVVAVSNPAFGLIANNYTGILFIAATAAVIGSLRSIPLAFVGGLVVGISRNLVEGYLTWGKSIAGLRSSAPFWILFLVLWLLGRDRSRRAASVSAEVPPPDYLTDLPRWRKALPWVIATTLLVVWTLGSGSGTFLGSNDAIWRTALLHGLALGLIFLSYVIVTGMGGMVSLAQTAFVTMGAMVTGLSIDKGLPFVPAVLIGSLAAVAIGVVVALPALRLSGIALALATLALAFIGDLVLFQHPDLSNSLEGGWTIPRPRIGPFNFTDDASMIMLLLGLVLLTAWAIRNLQRSAWGRAMVAVRAAESAAATSGVSPVKTKLGLFAVSAFIAGVGGALYASTNPTTVTHLSFPVALNLFWIAVAVTFGVRRPGGAIVAGIVSQILPVILANGFRASVLPSFLSWGGTGSEFIPPILFGLGAINLARNPDGVVALVGQRRWERRKARRDRRDTRAEEARVAAIRASEESAIEAEVERHARELLDAGIVHTPGSGSTSAAEVALELRGVRAGYGEIEVLHGIDLSVLRGQVVVLLGANGAGKSTLCAVASGLIAPRAGHVVLNGTDITAFPPHRRARQGFLLAPESRGIFPGLSVDENLALWLATTDERDQAYARFPLLAKRRRLAAGNLSGGEQQMLTLAPVVVRPPHVLVADEPTLGLAPMVVSELMGVFADLRDRGVTVLLVEEKARDVLAIADAVSFLELGHVAWTGPRHEVDDARLAAAYLGAITR